MPDPVSSFRVVKRDIGSSKDRADLMYEAMDRPLPVVSLYTVYCEYRLQQNPLLEHHVSFEEVPRKETKVVGLVGDSLGRDNVEPSAPASSTSLQGSSNRSIPGSGCTPRGGFKVAPRAPANGDGNVLFITPCSRSLPLLPLKPEIGSTCWSCCGV